MTKIYVLRAPAGLIILGSEVVTIPSNATFQVRKGNAMMEARSGKATAHVVRGNITMTEGK